MTGGQEPQGALVYQVPPAQALKKKRSFWKTAGIGCGGLFALLVACGVIGALMNGGTTPSATDTTGSTGVTAGSMAAEPRDAAAEEEASEAAAAEPTAEPTVEPSAEPTPLPAVGQQVAAGEVAWTVVKAEDLGQELKSDNQFIDSKTTSGKFVRVEYLVENRQDQADFYEAPKLVDEQNRTFDPSSDALFFIPSEQQCVLENLNPSIARTCVNIYEVPGDATGLRARLTNFALVMVEQVDVALGL